MYTKYTPYSLFGINFFFINFMRMFFVSEEMTREQSYRGKFENSQVVELYSQLIISWNSAANKNSGKTFIGDDEKSNWI